MIGRTTSRHNAIQRRRRASVATVAVTLVAVAWAFAMPLSLGAWADPIQSFKVIVHPNNPVHSISQDFLAQAFFKQTVRWQDGENIRPVDLPLSDPARRAFSSSVLKRSVSAVRAYWLQRIFSGRQVPPLELESDAAVVRFVLGSPGAIGYVSSTTNTSTAKIVSLR